MNVRTKFNVNVNDSRRRVSLLLFRVLAFAKLTGFPKRIPHSFITLASSPYPLFDKRNARYLLDAFVQNGTFIKIRTDADPTPTA